MAVSNYFDELVLLWVRQEEGKVSHLEELLVAIFFLTDSSESSASLCSIWHEAYRFSKGLISDIAAIKLVVWNGWLVLVASLSLLGKR